MMGHSEAAVEGSATGPAPPTVFELLADESRFAILRALLTSGDEPVGYSTLRRRADIDDSGRFNYHLMRLTDTLVADVEGGYELRGEAEALLDAALSSPLLADPVGRPGGTPVGDRRPSPATESPRYSD